MKVWWSGSLQFIVSVVEAAGILHRPPRLKGSDLTPYPDNHVMSETSRVPNSLKYCLLCYVVFFTKTDCVVCYCFSGFNVKNFKLLYDHGFRSEFLTKITFR